MVTTRSKVTKVVSTAGHPRPKPPRAGMGRPKGSKNILSQDVKTMIIEAFQVAGGVDYLAAQAVANPAAFLALFGKLVTTHVVAEVLVDDRVAKLQAAIARANAPYPAAH